MKNEDKEAFEKWFKLLGDSHLERVVKLNRGASHEAWKSACEYKQKEIEWLDNEETLRNHMNSIGYRELKKLQTENAKLKECVEFYALTSSWNEDAKICSEDHEFFQKWLETLGGKRARQILKELEEK